MPHDPFHIVILSATGDNPDKAAEELGRKASEKAADGYEPVSSSSTVHTNSPPQYNLFLVMRRNYYHGQGKTS